MEQEWQRLAAVVEAGIVHGVLAQAAADKEPCGTRPLPA